MVKCMMNSESYSTVQKFEVNKIFLCLEPILHLHRIRKMCRAPEPGGPLSLKEVFS